MQTLKQIHAVIYILFLLCYAYQLIYIPIALLAKRKKKPKAQLQKPTHSFAVLIAARNEEGVLPDLLRSIRSQNYPQELIRTFVIADNCTDGTAFAARRCGARVYIRNDLSRIGKGYALSELLRRIRTDCPEGFDGYLVFDADNILTPDFIREMDRKLGEGCDIVTGYRNSKNYEENWISSGYAVWFLRSCRFMDSARETIGSSSHVTGTGFMFSRAVRESMPDWPYHMLTEDFEFTVDQILKGKRVAYCDQAEFFDEQPSDMVSSWHQRVRWTQGYLQVLPAYGKRLIHGMMHGSYSCFDITMSVLPAFVLSMLSALCNLAMILLAWFSGESTAEALRSLLRLLAGGYLTLFAIGALTVISEWNRIRATVSGKIRSVFTFPLYMATYIPITISALFCRPEWKPILHRVTAVQMQLPFPNRGLHTTEIKRGKSA